MRVRLRARRRLVLVHERGADPFEKVGAGVALRAGAVLHEALGGAELGTEAVGEGVTLRFAEQAQRHLG